MLGHMSELYDKITGVGQKHDSYLMNIFDALETSKNQRFLNYISGERTKWETGQSTFTPEDVIRGATSVYNNLVKKKIWDKQDP